VPRDVGPGHCVQVACLFKQLYFQYKSVGNAVLLVALTGMVFIYPFYQSHFRLSLGVAVLSALLLYFPKLPIMTTAILSGIMVVSLRSAVYLPAGLAEFGAAMVHNAPAIMYYLVFGACFKLFAIRRFLDNVPVLILLLSITDSLSNCLELVVRSEVLPQNVEQLIVPIIAAAVVRAVAAVLGYYALKQYRDFALAEDRLARYAELIVLIAQLKTELFYLKKSSQDIEKVMELSYSLYQRLNAKNGNGNCEEAGQALTVAKDIHEVKKDYYRVVAGIEKVLEPSAVEQGLRLSEIFFIIEQNTLRSFRSNGKELDLKLSFHDDFVTDKHYAIVSILNNLIINAIEACSVRCRLVVEQTFRGEYNEFVVSDNGSGINGEDFELIFQPGYSTKFCPHTGKMSTGLGLAHVKNLTESLGGTIDLVSEPGRYTRFAVALPLKNLLIKELNKV